MLVRDVMTTPAVTVTADTPLKQVARLLDERSVTSLPVVDGRGHIVGVISEADVILVAVPHDARAHETPRSLTREPTFTRTSQVMSRHPVTVSSWADLAEATDLMTSTSVKSLPVVDDGVLVGVVSRRDVVRTLARSDDRIEAELDDLLDGLDDGWLLEVVDGVVIADGPDDERERAIVRALASTVPGVVAVQFR